MNRTSVFQRCSSGGPIKRGSPGLSAGVSDFRTNELGTLTILPMRNPLRKHFAINHSCQCLLGMNAKVVTCLFANLPCCRAATDDWYRLVGLCVSIHLGAGRAVSFSLTSASRRAVALIRSVTSQQRIFRLSAVSKQMCNDTDNHLRVALLECDRPALRSTPQLTGKLES